MEQVIPQCSWSISVKMPVCHVLSLPVLMWLYCGEEMTSILKNELYTGQAGGAKLVREKENGKMLEARRERERR